MNRELSINNVWKKRNIGKSHHIAIPNNYSELKTKEGRFVFYDKMSKSIVFSTNSFNGVDPKLVLYSAWKKLNGDKKKEELDIGCRTKMGMTQYKLEITKNGRFFLFVLIIDKEEQFLIELSSLLSDKEGAIKEFDLVINSIRRKRDKDCAN